MKLQLTDAEYFALPQLSNSDLGLIKKSYSHYLEKHKRKTTDAMIIGKAFDQLVLRPDIFHENFVVAPDDLDRRTKQGKELWQELKNSGREIIKYDDWVMINLMKSNVDAHPLAPKIISGAENEGIYTGILCGEEVRIKVDIVHDGYIFDIKTCENASSDEFRKSIGKWSYHRQAAFYIDVLKQNIEGVKGFGFIAVERVNDETPANSGVATYWLDSESIDYGRLEYQALIKKYQSFKNNPNQYTGYSSGLSQIGVPLWAVEQGIDR